jgi:prepilin-type processing-associated H-X9-DG protein
MNNLKQQGVASQMYQDDNDAYFLAIYEDMKGTGIKYWCENMAPYTNTRVVRGTLDKTDALWRCPTATDRYGTYFQSNIYSATNSYHVNYSYNAYLGFWPAAKSWMYRESDVYRTSDTVLIMDAITYGSNDAIVEQSGNANYWRITNVSYPWKYFHMGTGGQMNVVFVDGHAAAFHSAQIKSGWFKIREFWKDAELTSNSPTGS